MDQLKESQANQLEERRLEERQLKERIEAGLLGGLNSVQQEAVLHDRGPLLILAGAGSGKTRVITHRIAYLLHIKGVAAWNISAVTFTNKATREMQERLVHLAGPAGANVFVRTFHSLGLHVIRRHASLLGLKSGFSIVDQSTQLGIIKAMLKERGIDSEELKPQTIAHHINRARDALLSPEQYQEKLDQGGAPHELLVPLYREYILRLRKNNSVDFGDLLYETVQLMLRHEEVAEQYRRLWRYFMIDEYQDTNRAQYLLGRAICGEHRNIMVVGDDDQSIYSWRGADIGNILNFEKDYPEARVLKLEQNYRSSAVILQAAAAVIANNRNRREKSIYTQQAAGEKIKLAAYGSGNEEAYGVTREIAMLLEEKVSPGEIAIFYRTNAQSRIFEQVLRQNRIPYILVGDIRFYDRKEIKDLLAYLNVIVNPEDDLSLERIINVPARKLGDSSQARLKSLAAAKGISLLEALPFSAELPNMRAHPKMKILYRHFQAWRRAFLEGELPSKIAEDCLKQSGYLKALEEENSIEANSRIENLYEFLNSLKEYEREELRREGQPALQDFLQQISLYSEERSEGAPASDCLHIMTLHNAKGLEFSHTFICGVEEGYLPHSLSKEQEELEEERRLMYVGITRARQRLYLSWARFRQLYGRTKERTHSRFLEEMSDCLDGQLYQNSSDHFQEAPQYNSHSSQSRNSYNRSSHSRSSQSRSSHSHSSQSRSSYSHSGHSRRGHSGYGRHSRGEAGQGRSHPGERKNYRGYRGYREASNPKASNPEASDPKGNGSAKPNRGAPQRYAVRERVMHGRYGKGVVAWAEETGLGQKVAIRFEGEQKERIFLTLYAPLQKIAEA